MGLSGTHGYNIYTRVLIDVLCFLFSCILVLFNSIYGIILRVLFCRLFSVVNSKTLQKNFILSKIQLLLFPKIVSPVKIQTCINCTL